MDSDTLRKMMMLAQMSTSGGVQIARLCRTVSRKRKITARVRIAEIEDILEVATDHPDDSWESRQCTVEEGIRHVRDGVAQARKILQTASFGELQTLLESGEITQHTLLVEKPTFRTQTVARKLIEHALTERARVFAGKAIDSTKAKTSTSVPTDF